MKSRFCCQPVQDFNSLQVQMNRISENGTDPPRRAEYNYFGQSCRLPSEDNGNAAEVGPLLHRTKTIESSPSKRKRHESTPGN